MTIKLNLRKMSAYWETMRIAVADNEKITIELRPQLPNAYLLFNGNIYVFENNCCVIPHGALTDVNVCELQQRENNVVTARYPTENLYLLPVDKNYNGNHLEAEREFYALYIKSLLERIDDLTAKVNEITAVNSANNQRIADLENGKFKLFNFGGEENNETSNQ